MQKYIQLITEFHNSNPSSLEFIKTHLPKYLKDHSENQTEIEEILDYLFSNPTVDISKIGYDTLRSKTIKWHTKLQATATKDTEVEGVDYEVALKLDDDFQFVKLVSKESFEREGKLMSHCVASYFGRDTNIYSLRDRKNLPHCTIEDGSQVKGKGNGPIDPKYVDYVVQFLEHLGMTVGENEMKNLGYYKLDSIEKDLTCDKLYNGYVCEKNIDKIKDKNENQYKGMGLWNIKPVCEIEDDGKFLLYEDIKGVVAYENLICVKEDKNSTRNASSGYSTRNASSGYSTRNASSGDSTRNASSGYSTRNASSGDSTRNASSGHYTRNASSGDHTQNASSGEYTRNASSGDHTQNASSGHSTRNASSGDSTRNASSGDHTQNASSGFSTQNASSGYSTRNASSGDHTQNASSGDHTQNASSGDHTQNASSGDSTRNASSGDHTQNASSGDSTRNASSGHYTQNASSGDSTRNASSGDSTRSEVNGKYGITADIGIGSKSKGVIGTWIVLAEYGENSEGYMQPVAVKCGQIDGTILKADTWYILKGGEFTETE